jgi:flavodoxin
MKVLVVYYSRTGYTKRVAHSLARRLNADLEEIGTDPRPGARGYLRCALESMLKLQTAIHTPQHDPAAYGLVLVGGPVWVWGLSSPVRSYLMQRRRRLPQVAFFCTMGGSGAQRVFDAMTTLAGKRPLATLALTDRDIDAHGQHWLDAFVQALRLPHAPAARTARRVVQRRRAGAAATAAS